MIDVPFALAFTAGMVATVNPCGFAMLPAYLALFASGETEVEPVGQRFRRALAVAAAVATGFVVVFGLLGVLFHLGVRVFIEVVPYAALGIGVVLVVAGVAMWRGWRPSVALPSAATGSSDRTVKSMVLFGMSYGVASLSCTLPVFLSVVIGTATRSSLAGGLAALAAYVAGMTVVLALATVAVAASQRSLMALLRGVSRHTSRIAAMLLVLTGAYLVYYWSWALLTDGTTDTGYGPIGFVQDRSSAVTARILRHWELIAIVSIGVVAAALMVAVRGRDPRELSPTEKGAQVPITPSNPAPQCCTGGPAGDGDPVAVEAAGR